MSELVMFTCDGPECDVMRPAQQNFNLPPDGWLSLRMTGHKEQQHFHSVECLIRYAESLRVGEKGGTAG